MQHNEYELIIIMEIYFSSQNKTIVHVNNKVKGLQGQN